MLEDRTYTVKEGDTYDTISRTMYGTDSHAGFLEGVNNGSYLIPGEVLIVPPVVARSESVQTVLPGVGAGDLSIIIAGKRIVPESARVLRAMDAAVDGWTAVIEWTPEMAALVSPFSYPSASVYIGGQLAVNGAVYGVKSEFKERREIILEGYSFMADAVDSSMAPPYQTMGVTLRQHAEEVLKPLGMRPIFQEGVSEGELFNGSPVDDAFGVTDAEPDTGIFDHLSKYAFQRDLLIASSPSGDPIFLQANISGGTVGVLYEGGPHVLEWSGEFDGRKRFNTYRSFGYSPLSGDKAVEAKDAKVPRYRTMAFKADDTEAWDIGYTAEWKRSKQVADSISIKLPLDTWYAPDGTLWTYNTLVSVVSKTLFVPGGFDFLIKSVEYAFDKKGRTAEISLVPPGVYAPRGKRAEDPWMQFQEE